MSNNIFPETRECKDYHNFKLSNRNNMDKLENIRSAWYADKILYKSCLESLIRNNKLS